MEETHPIIVCLFCLGGAVKSYLPMEKGSNGKVPGSESGHDKSQERPDSVIVEGRDEHSCRTAGSKYVCPSSLVEVVVYVVYVTAWNIINHNQTDIYIHHFLSHFIYPYQRYCPLPGTSYQLDH